MNLTNEQKNAQPLLELDIIIMPKTIDHAAYKEILWATQYLAHKASDEIRLYCCGEGGDLSTTMAVIDVVRSAGVIVTGILTGEAASSHSIVWAACHRRKVGNYAMIGIHNAGSVLSLAESGWIRREGSDIKAQGIEMEYWDDRVSGIYARASNKTSSEWRTWMAEGRIAMKMFKAEELVEMRMAEWL